jgi:aryl-alcohol dehydrogenase-like predicted oxidoreductase
MRYNQLGTTDLQVSAIGLGTWQFGGEWGKTFTIQEVDRILNTARLCGINFIDTAECYGNHLSESLIGRCIRHDRERWVVGTKFGHIYHDFMHRSEAWSPKEVLQQLEDSLQALKSDYVDLYQLHSGSNEVFDNQELWTMLDKQVKAGKVRHLGISLSKSTSSPYQVQNARRVGARVIQLPYNRLCTDAETLFFPEALAQGLGVVARTPLASGYLSGKYEHPLRFHAQDIRSAHSKSEINRQLSAVAELRDTQLPPHIPMAQWALAWCLQHPAVTTVIPGCKSAEQVRLNAQAAELDIATLSTLQV